jgi:molybdenum cofactor cytidylyltransferase
MADVAAVILAAGRSSRYRAAGGAEVSKLVADFGGQALVRTVARAALASRAAPVVVVTGHAREAVEGALKGLPLGFAYNPDFASGLASSLKAGVAALPETARGALVLLGDMPAVAPAAIDRIIAAFLARPAALAVAPIVAGRRGNPVLLSRALFAKVARLLGDEGARRLLGSANAGDVAEVPFDEAGVALDIDTPEDLVAARKLL